MAALVPTTVQEIEGGVTQQLYGTADVPSRTIRVKATSTAVTNTIDLATYVDTPVTGIRTLVEILDGAANAGTANTWSGTVLTLAGHAGSGVWELLVTVY